VTRFLLGSAAAIRPPGAVQTVKANPNRPRNQLPMNARA
jgi:hypothetical protein